MKQEVFSAEITGELLSLYKCDRCGRTGDVCFREPTVQPKPNDCVQLIFPVTCRCRHGAFLRIDMGLLQFGNLLAQSVLRRPFKIGELKQVEARPLSLLAESWATLPGLVVRYETTKAGSNVLPLRVSVLTPPVNQRARREGQNPQSN